MAVEYPIWKKVLIEGMRAFVGAFVTQLVALIAIPEIKDALLASANTVTKCLIPFDKVCFFGASIWSDSWVLLVIPAGIAGIQGLLKWLREKYAVNRLGNPDYEHWLFKIPG